MNIKFQHKLTRIVSKITGLTGLKGPFSVTPIIGLKSVLVIFQGPMEEGLVTDVKNSPVYGME